MTKTHTTPAGRNIFKDLNVPNADHEKLRFDLLLSLRKWFDESGLTQQEAAKKMGIRQPHLNYALKFQYEKFTIDRLVKMLGSVGQHVKIIVENTDKAA